MTEVRRPRPYPFPPPDAPHTIDEIKLRLSALVELRDIALDEGRLRDYDLYVVSIDRWLGRLSYLLPEPSEGVSS